MNSKNISHLTRTFLALSTVILCSSACAQKREPNHFAIYTARLDGSAQQTILADSDEEMTHARVSPDQKWITFTKYRRKGFDGIASEDGGYAQTEIDICKLDGSEVETVVPAIEGRCSANSSWTPDGKGLVFCSNRNDPAKSQLLFIDLETRKIRSLPTPDGLMVSDPHWVGDTVAFSVAKEDKQSLWIMHADGSQPRQISKPPVSGRNQKDSLLFGDYDAWVSPDEKNVAFMRLMPDGTFHSFVVNVESGAETDLSKGINGVDAVPEWSADGKLLIFWHANLENPSEIGIYTVRADGTDRKMIALPRGLQQMHPGFFPKDATESNPRIIYNARVNKAIR